MRKIYSVLALFVLFSSLFASGAEEIAAGKALVDAKADCGKLSQEQLESIGEYIMELRADAFAAMAQGTGRHLSSAKKNLECYFSR